MRIGYVLSAFSPLSEAFIRREVLALCRAGQRVFVYTNQRYNDPQVPTPDDPNLTVREIPFVSNPSALAEAAFADGIEHLHASLMSAAHRAAFVAARALNLPFTLMAYSGVDLFTRRDPELYRTAAQDPLCVSIIVEDAFMRDWMREQFGVRADKLSLIPNSFDLDLYRLRAERTPRESVRILSIARFVEKKGLAYLVAAFKQISSGRAGAELWLVGYGPEENSLRAAAGGDSRIKFLGAKSEEETRRLYAEADIFCLPCIQTTTGDADGVPTTLLEAMAFELPVIGTNLLSTPCYVKDGQDGLLVRPRDVVQLAAALERLCADATLRREMGRSARARVSEICDLKVNIERLQQLFIEGRSRNQREKPATLESQRRSDTETQIVQETTNAPLRLPLVSICITTYNRAELVRQAIDSVLAQTYRNVEVIVVDDASTDDTRRVLESYGARIRVARNERNRGMSFSKNRALRMTSSEARYVGILDSDDYYDPRFVERCVEFLESHADIGLVYTDDILVDAAGREIRRQPAVEPWDIDTWLRTCNLRGDTWLVRRALLMKTTLHDEATEHDHDYDLFYQLLEITTFAHLPEFLAFIRQHEGRSTMANRLALATHHAANLVKFGYSPEYAYLRARRHPEWIPAIEAGIELGRKLYDERRRSLALKPATASTAARLAIDGGEPVRASFLPFGVPCLGDEEIAEVVETLRSGWIGTGPRAERFEREFAAYVGAEHAVSLNSCTAGLFLSLLALGVGAGDEVITTTLTFGATVNVIEHVGARPVLVDIDPDTLNLNPALVERAITPRTKAIMPVHFGGLSCDMDALRQIADKHNVAILEDAAHAVGTRFNSKMAGTSGTLASFSFYANKNLTTAEGGMVTTADAHLAAKIRQLRLHGLSWDAWKSFDSKLLAPDVQQPGYKYNMPDLAAAIGIQQLRKQERFLEIRERYAQRYDEAFADLPVRRQPRPFETEQHRHSLQLYVLILEAGRWRVSRDEVVRALLRENIGAAVHYPAIHTHSFYRDKYGYKPEDFPHAFHVSRQILSLPLTPSMADADAADVLHAVRKVAAVYAE